MLRRTAKYAVFLVALVVVSPLLLLAWLEKRLTGSEAIYVTFAQLLSIMPGPIGHYLRAAYYFGTLEDCSWQVHIGFGSLFTHRATRVAAKVSTGAYCVIGHAVIGEGVRMASRVSIPSGKRQHLDNNGQLSVETNYERLSIGSDAWLGEAATIIAHVGERSIVSAGAVVINDVPSDSVVGGNPAKVLKALERPVQPEADE